MNGKLVYLDTRSIVNRYIEEKGSEVIDRVYEESEAGSARVRTRARKRAKKEKKRLKFSPKPKAHANDIPARCS